METGVSLDQFQSIVKALEDERIAHTATKQQLMDVSDKLDFAEGQIEALKKQIQREKKQFEQTFGVMKTRRDQTKVLQLESQQNSHVTSSGTEHTDRTTLPEPNKNKTQKNPEVDELVQRLKVQRERHLVEMNELQIEKQQEQYFSGLSVTTSPASTAGGPVIPVPNSIGSVKYKPGEGAMTYSHPDRSLRHPAAGIVNKEVRQRLSKAISDQRGNTNPR